MNKTNLLKFKRIIFVVEPDAAKRFRTVTALLLDDIDAQKERRRTCFLFEAASPDGAVNGNPKLPANCRRMVFGAKSSPGRRQGTEWLDWARQTRLEYNHHFAVGVGDFHRLMAEPDGRIMFLTAPGEIVTQTTAARFGGEQFRGLPNTTAKFVLGVPDTDWLLTFMGIGARRSSGSGISTILDMTLETEVPLQPSAILKAAVLEQGMDELMLQRSVAVAFPTTATLPIRLVGEIVAPPPDLPPPGADEFLVFEPSTNVWGSESSLTAG